MGTGLKSFTELLDAVFPPSLSMAHPTLSVLKSPSTDRRVRERKKKESQPQARIKCGGKKTKLPTWGQGSVQFRALRKTVQVGVGTKNGSKTKTKRIGAKTPQQTAFHSRPSPLLPCTRQAGPPSGQGLHAGANTARPQPI